jgi:hypothetical protein
VAREMCLNCGCAIGDLETPYLWDEHVVCRSCYGKLQPTSRMRKGKALIGFAIVAIIALVAVGLFLHSRSKSEAVPQDASAKQETNPAQRPPTRIGEEEIFNAVRANQNATPDQLGRMLSVAMGGRRKVDFLGWGVSKRSGYKDGVELEVRNPRSDAASTDESVDTVRTDSRFANSSYFGTAIINEKVYVLYGATLLMSPSQSTQAAAIPLGTQNVGFVGDVTFYCFESSGQTFIALHVKDAMFD